MAYTKKSLVEQKLKLTRQDHLTGEDRSQLALIEEALAHYEALEALSKKIFISPPQNRWGTPDWYILDYVLKVFPRIDLDPASEPGFNKQVWASEFYDAETNGLAQYWEAQYVYNNPPYGKLMEQFLKKALQELVSGRCYNYIGLVNRSDGQWYRQLKKRWLLQGGRICEHYRRIAFVSIDGSVMNSPRYSQDTWYLGDSPDQFRKVFASLGNVYGKEYLDILQA